MRFHLHGRSFDVDSNNLEDVKQAIHGIRAYITGTKVLMKAANILSSNDPDMYTEFSVNLHSAAVILGTLESFVS
jgi:hypothetical protein